MMDGALLALLIALAMHDAFPDAMSPLPMRAMYAASLWLAPYLLITIAVALWTRFCGRKLDETGRFRWAYRAEIGGRLARLAVVAMHVVGVFYLGIVALVREALGDPVLLDEAFVLTPPVLALIGIYASWYIIERRLREAVLIRQLDEGESLAPIPPLGGYLIDQVRHRVLTVLIPVTLIAGWTEGVQRTAEARGWGEGLATALQYLGAGAALFLMPLLLQFIWATKRLGDGALRSRLESMCAEQRVRCRDLLVWRTHGGMINGALIGLIAPMRYVLLTDGLLDRLPMHQVEAVMAHELAHARRAHLPWMLGGLLAASGIAWALVAWMTDHLMMHYDLSSRSLVAIPPVILLTVLAFGYISRRFEWQADACAAQHLTGWTAAARRDGLSAPVIAPTSTEAMADALGAVARLNNIRARRNSFRHGSIATRQRRLREIVGLAADRLPIDRTVGMIKIVTAIALIVLAGLIVRDMLVAGAAP